MKVIFITREGQGLAGARVRCYNFARELARRGVETEVLSFADHLGARDGARESEMGLGKKLALNLRAFQMLLKERDAVFCIQKCNYHSLAPYLAHLVKRNKMILDLDDWEMREDEDRSKAYPFIKQLAQRSVFCVAASRFLEGFLKSFNKNVHYIPSGVDTEFFRPSGPRTPQDRLVFSWAGTFNRPEHAAGIRLALECFCILRKQYDSIHFEIAGDGTHRSLVERMVEKTGDPQVSLKGWIPPEEMPRYLDNIDFGLLPITEDSKFNRAKSPTKLFEYMAMAKPTVCSKAGEACHIIRDGENGLLADSLQEFTAKMQRLIEDPHLRIRIGDEARRQAEKNYSLSVLGQRFHGILKKFGLTQSGPGL